MCHLLATTCAAMVREWGGQLLLWLIVSGEGGSRDGAYPFAVSGLPLVHGMDLDSVFKRLHSGRRHAAADLSSKLDFASYLSFIQVKYYQKENGLSGRELCESIIKGKMNTQSVIISDLAFYWERVDDDR